MLISRRGFLRLFSSYLVKVANLSNAEYSCEAANAIPITKGCRNLIYNNKDFNCQHNDIYIENLS